MKAEFLLLRPDDHVVLGVAWSGLRVVGGGPSAAPTAEAVDDSAWVMLRLPPQHTGEETAPKVGAPRSGVASWQARRSSSSAGRRTFRFP